MAKSKAKQQMYRVRWEIDLPAETPLTAAQEALRVQRDHTSTATIFTVETRTKAGKVKKSWTIDLD